MARTAKKKVTKKAATKKKAAAAPRPAKKKAAKRTTVYDELIAALNLKPPKRTETAQDWLKRAVKAMDKADEAEWETYSEALQDWFNEAAEAANDKEPIAIPQGAPFSADEPDEEESEEEEEEEDEEEEEEEEDEEEEEEEEDEEEEEEEEEEEGEDATETIALGDLEEDQEVTVVLNTGETISGIVTAVAARAVTVETDEEEVRIRHSKIAKVYEGLDSAPDEEESEEEEEEEDEDESEEEEEEEEQPRRTKKKAAKKKVTKKKAGRAPRMTKIQKAIDIAAQMFDEPEKKIGKAMTEAGIAPRMQTRVLRDVTFAIERYNHHNG